MGLKITKDWAMGNLGLMFSFSVGYLKRIEASEKKKEEIREVHRFLRTLIEEYFKEEEK